MNAGIIVMLAVLILLLVCAVYLSTGRGGWILSGYNTMPAEEKQKYDEPRLCRAAGHLLFLIVALFLAAVAGAAFHHMWLFWLCFFAILAVTIGAVVDLNQSGRFKKKE